MVLRHCVKGILTLCGGVLIHLSLGTIYTFGNMSPYITSYLRYEQSDTSLRYSDSMWIFAVTAVGQGLFITAGGIMNDKISARWTCLIGGIIMSFGVFITYFAIQRSFAVVVLTYGLLSGMGIGISYAIPINCAMKWFPSHKGLISGIILCGFGAGAFIFDQVQTAYINPHNLKANVTVGPKNEKYFRQHELLERVPISFILLGCVYAAMNVFGVLLIMKPEQDGSAQASIYTTLMEDNSGSDSEVNHEDSIVIHGNHPKDIVKTREFWTLWFMFFVNGQAVTFTATLYKTFGQTFISDDQFLAIVGSFASICNGCFRILWGYLADRTNFRFTMIIQCILMASLFVTFALTEKGGKVMYFIWVCLMFGTFCGNYALFPTATVKTFGQKYFPINYGLVFSSQIPAAVMGTLLAEILSDRLGWFGMFSLVAGFSALGLILAISFNAVDRNGKYV